MEKDNSLEMLDKLEQGMFYTVQFPLTNNISCPVTSMYMGKDKEGHYNFFDGSGGSGRFAISRKYVEQGKIYIDKEYDEEKSVELHSKLLLQQEKKHKKDRECR